MACTTDLASVALRSYGTSLQRQRVVTALLYLGSTHTQTALAESFFAGVCGHLVVEALGHAECNEKRGGPCGVNSGDVQPKFSLDHKNMACLLVLFACSCLFAACNNCWHVLGTLGE